MKTNKEMNKPKEKIESTNKKLAELNEKELNQVTGGDGIKIQVIIAENGTKIYDQYGEAVIEIADIGETYEGVDLDECYVYIMTRYGRCGRLYRNSVRLNVSGAAGLP